MNRTKYTLVMLAAFALGGCAFSGGAADTDDDGMQRAWRTAGPGSISGTSGGGGGGSERVVVAFTHPTQANGPSPDPWHSSSPTEGPSPDPWNPLLPDQPPPQPGTPNNGGGNGNGDDD